MTKKEKQDVRSAQIRVASLGGIFETAQEFGCDLTQELSLLGITPDVVEQGSEIISIQKMSEALLVASRITKCADFPVELAARQNLSDVSSLILLLKTAPTLRESFQKVLEYGHHYAPSMQWILDTSRDNERLLFAISCHALTSDEYAVCGTFILAQTYYFIEAIAGEAPALERVKLVGNWKGDLAALTRRFGAPIDVDTEFFGLEFVTGTLDTHLIYANSELHRHIQSYITMPGAPVAASFEQKVRAVIRSQLPTQTLSIERVAAAFDCCERTLQRQLKSECGITYTRLVEEERFDLARQFLEQSRMTITDLAYAVGYSNPANFSRAFKNMFGCGPRDWRNEQSREARTISR